MSKQIIISHHQGRTQLAKLINGELCEILTENQQDASLVGNIYLATVVRVLKGLQAVFVDIGRQRTAFLSMRDVHADDNQAKIEKLFYQSQPILVQVIKDEVGDKGARLSTRISIEGCHLVYLPNGNGIGVSSRLNVDLKKYLKSVLSDEFARLGLSGAVIVRTSAQNVETGKLLTELHRLSELWHQSHQKASHARQHKVKYELLHQSPPLYLRHLHEMKDVSTQLWVDDAVLYQKILDFVCAFLPDAAFRVNHYIQTKPIFKAFDVECQMEQALCRTVDLSSGGQLVIDHTEAMTVIDVNTGAFVGKHDQAMTIHRTNMEAALQIARHIRLRNISGIIIIDFIDMLNDEHQKSVLQTLKTALKNDPVQTTILGFTRLGLLEMTRKRTTKSLRECVQIGSREKAIQSV
ncbi:Rne/Rng family ribonuclease [Moraxella oculi]|uniref:Rne/Rng family ribonuclease n=1 Tax=Moraxella oculi TaxID=2940516 RepID=A0ABW8U5H3_9GAMM